MDELIVVDGSSTDNTVEICKKYTDKIYIQPARGYGDIDRPFAISKTNGDWILNLDADETLSKELHDSIRELVNKTKYVAYCINRRTYYSNDLTKFSKWKDYQVRLFRKDSAVEIGRPHTGVTVYGKVKTIDSPINHYIPDFFTYSMFMNYHIKTAKIYSDYQIKAFPNLFYYLKAVASLFFYSIKYFLGLRWYVDGWDGFKGSVYLGGLYFFYVNYYIARRKKE